MSSYDDDIDEARAELVTRRMAEAFGFLRDLINDPAVAARVPDGSTLVCRSISEDDAHFRLTAYRPAETAGDWAARVTRGSTVSGSQVKLPPAIEQIVKTGTSAEAALDALEAELRALLVATNGLPNRQRVRG